MHRQTQKIFKTRRLYQDFKTRPQKNHFLKKNADFKVWIK
jgi:hypothetical protein